RPDDAKGRARLCVGISRGDQRTIHSGRSPRAVCGIRHDRNPGESVLAGHSRVVRTLHAMLPFWLMLGASAWAQPMICPGGTIALDISAAAKPFVRMRLGGREGNFLIDTGATRTQ